MTRQKLDRELENIEGY